MSDDYYVSAKELASQMTLEEKALLLTGDGWWATHRIDRLEIPSVSVTDGPHGVRKGQGRWACEKRASNLFSYGVGTGFVVEPGVNPTGWGGPRSGKPSQRCADSAGTRRQYETLTPWWSEFRVFLRGSLLAGKMAVAYIEGVQSEGVGTSLKHYAVNNQEFERMATSSDLDERTLNEIYLPAFEIAVKGAQPWSVMSAYNLVNGIYASEDERLLQDILRDRWGFTGFVVSDWGGVNDRVESLRAGTDLEMPGTGESREWAPWKTLRVAQRTDSRL